MSKLKKCIQFNLFSPSFFWVIFLFDSFTPLFLILDNIGYPFLVYFKIFSVAYIVNSIMVFLKYDLRINIFSSLFLFFGLIFVIIGFLNNTIGNYKYIISSLFGILNPILMMNLARIYLKLYPMNYIIDFHIKFVFKYYVVITIPLYFIYYFLHYYMGRYVYFGFQTNWQYASVYLMYAGRIPLGILGFLLAILAGKRSTIVTSFLPFFPYIFFKNKMTFQHIFITILVFLALLFMFFFAYEHGFFRRFELTLNIDLNDDQSIDLGTGGRFSEVKSIFESFENDVFSLLLGSGLGANYVIDTSAGFMEKNFAHFAPVHFVFQFGLIFTVLLYLFFILYIIKGYKRNPRDLFYNFFLVVFLGSFFGANLMVDPKTWFLVGLYYYNINCKKNE